MKNIIHSARIIKVLDGAATGTTALQSVGVDMSGFESVLFVGRVATVNAGNFAHVQQGADDSADWEDVAGSKQVPANDGDSFAIEVVNPGDRYVRVSITRAGASTVTGDVYAILGHPRAMPPGQGATITAPLVLNGSTEGTP